MPRQAREDQPMLASPAPLLQTGRQTTREENQPVFRYGVFIAIALVLLGTAFDLGRRGARAYENMQVQRIGNALDALGMNWAQIQADGLKIQLHGHAPDLFAQNLALESARATAPAARVSNFSTATLAPPEYRAPVRIELHRDANGITLTGQTASRFMREALNEQLRRDAADLEIRDLTGIQAAIPPRGWGPEIDVASLAASALQDAYVVVEPGQVSVTGGVPGAEARDKLTADLLARAGDGPSLVLRLNIPPRVVAPFAFSAYKDAGGGTRLERCSARDHDEQAQILGALSGAGIEHQQSSCPVGLGGPTGDWTAAVEASLKSLALLPAGRVDIEYHLVDLVVAPPASPAELDEAMDELATGLPAGFDASGALSADDIATLASISQDRYWLRIGRRVDGVTLTGLMPKGPGRAAVEVYAAALFGGPNVASDLIESPASAPSGWHNAALDLLGRVKDLSDAEVQLAGHRMRLQASLTDPAHAATLHNDLQSALPEFDISTRITVNVPDAVNRIPLPSRPCAAVLERIVREQPIDFDTGSAKITSDSSNVLDQLAGRFARCEGGPIEIGGHTDSQGAEDLNERISLSRAEAVRTALTQRGVPIAQMTARGYGEAEPIADNRSDAGRARNRRITFKPAPLTPEDAAETVEEN